MSFFVLALTLTLSAGPYMGEPVTRQEADGTWTCGGACHTTGNADGGECHVAVHASRQSSERACLDDLERQCRKLKPPRGGCRLGRTP